MGGLEHIEVVAEVSFQSMLTAKLYRWLRRNLYLYLLSAVLFSVAASLLGGSAFQTALIVVPLVLVSSLGVMVVSAAVQSRTLANKAVKLVLSEETVVVTTPSGTFPVPWSWVKPVEETSTHFVLRRDSDAHDLIFVRKGGTFLPTEEHEQTLRRWASKG